jgi:hypothetical protein
VILARCVVEATTLERGYSASLSLPQRLERMRDAGELAGAGHYFADGVRTFANLRVHDLTKPVDAGDTYSVLMMMGAVLDWCFEVEHDDFLPPAEYERAAQPPPRFVGTVASMGDAQAWWDGLEDWQRDEVLDRVESSDDSDEWPEWLEESLIGDRVIFAAPGDVREGVAFVPPDEIRTFVTKQERPE